MPTPSTLPFLPAAATRHGFSQTTEFDLNSLNSWGRVIAAYDAPSQTTHAERLFLYGMVVAKRPSRVLEVGFRFGGTAFLMLNALSDAGVGRLVAIDPHPEPVLDFGEFADRFTLLNDRSPEAIPHAVNVLGGPIDLCFLDGDHSYDAVRADLIGLLPHMANESYIVMHDAAHPDVARATEEFLALAGRHVVDCGLVCPWVSETRWSGLRMLRVLDASAPSLNADASLGATPIATPHATTLPVSDPPAERRRWPWSKL